MRETIGSRPVTVVVAAAGYGKTAAVQTWLRGRPALWCAGSAPATIATAARAEGDPFVVVDRPAILADEPPPGVRLVLVSRTPLGGPVSRWRCRGIVTDIGPTNLTLPAGAVAELLTRHGATDPALAGALWRLTGGWPALTRMGAEALGQRVVEPAELPRLLAAPGTAIHGFVTEEVCGELPPAARRLALDLADLEWATDELVLALNHRDGRRMLRHLVAVGLAEPAAGAVARYRLVPVVAAVLRERRRAPARRRALAAAATWYAAQGEPTAAIRAALAADDPGACARLLAGHGADLLRRGQPATVCAAVRALPADVLDDGIRLLHAEALHVTGDIGASLAVYHGLDAGGPLPAGLAWRYGMARYLHGEPEAGLDVLRRGLAAADADGALLLAWHAAAYWKLGDAAACGDFAARAYDAARSLADGRALAAAHVALALHAQITGDRPAIQAHYERALAAAEAVGDRFSIVRIRTNRTSSLLYEARYAEALDMIEPAVALAESGGYVALLALALCNQAESLARLGRLDEAVATYERSATLWQRLDTEKLAYALAGLGDLYRRRGRTSQARAAYEEAIRVLRGSGDWQVLVRTLAGLARVLAETDPELAKELADRAVAQTPGPLLATALIAAGWVAAARAASEDPPSAQGWARVRELADAAADAARRHRNRAALAEALELAAHATAEAATARQMLTEALAIWCEAGADLDADRVRVGLAGEVEARLAADRLAGAGIVAAGTPRPSRRVPVLETSGADPAGEPEPVALQTLGRFAVSIGGQPVPLAAWRSRKARDLLRVLVGRRGRAIARDELSELLWPGEPVDRVSHRLSVALSMVRAVLDPGRRAGADYFISGDTGSLALNQDRLSIDAETFAQYARFGLDSLRAERWRDARAALDAAERAYAGDFLDDEPYDDHATAVREQLRATFLQVERALAGLARRAGEHDDAVRCLLRLLGADPYDEAAHRELIDLLSRCGRHGEARRARARFVSAMDEIGVDVPRAAIDARPVPA